jgi:hypothetical protein
MVPAAVQKALAAKQAAARGMEQRKQDREEARLAKQAPRAVLAVA